MGELAPSGQAGVAIRGGWAIARSPCSTRCKQLESRAKRIIYLRLCTFLAPR